MKVRTICFAAALALALPANALGAEEASSVVPPENSAATQYTEAIPTAGGDKETDGGRKPSPAKVLGAKNAKRLESHGKEGREVAEIVAETAPAPAADPSVAEEPTPPRKSSPQNTASSETQGSDGEEAGGAGAGKGSGPPSRPTESPAAKQTPASTELPSGSSGLGEVIAEATGSSSSGQLGGLLPLAILAAIVWALAYFWRQQKRPVG